MDLRSLSIEIILSFVFFSTIVDYLQEGRHTSFEYGRYGNPTTTVLEEKMRSLLLLSLPPPPPSLWRSSIGLIRLLCVGQRSGEGRVNVIRELRYVRERGDAAGAGSSRRAHSDHHRLLQEDEGVHPE